MSGYDRGRRDDYDRGGRRDDYDRDRSSHRDRDRGGYDDRRGKRNFHIEKWLYHYAKRSY